MVSDALCDQALEHTVTVISVKNYTTWEKGACLAGTRSWYIGQVRSTAKRTAWGEADAEREETAGRVGTGGDLGVTVSYQIKRRHS